MSDIPYVALDLRAVQAGFKSHQGRGIGRYVRSLLDAMLPLDPERHLGLVAEAGAELRGLSRHVEGRLCRVETPPWTEWFGPDGVHVRQHLVWPRALARVAFDFFHFFSQTDAPARFERPYFVTVLDLIPHRMPEAYSHGKNRLRFRAGRWLERRALSRADGLIAISEYTRRDLARLLGIAADRIAVTPLGVSAGLGPANPAEVSALCRRHQLMPGYLLYVGGIDPRKNVPFLLEVVLAITLGRPEVELVLAGNYRDDPDFPELVGRVQRLGLERSVRLLGYAPDEELAALYSGAAAFVYPSLYEGFGLPPLEAMACGTPVVAANRTALPEILGDAAVLADPEDVTEFAQAITAFLDRPERRAAFVEAGRRRAARFTWEATARATIEAYRRFAEFRPS